MIPAMIKHVAGAIAVVVCLTCCVCGCVSPRSADLGVLTDYQRALVRRGPQQRQAAEGIGQLAPAPVAGLPELKITKDPRTGTLQVYLPLEEAVIRALANSLDIRLVSFDPAMSHEEAVKAAAAFDYIVFGGWQYVKEDKQSSSTFVSGQTKNWTYQAGIKQMTITGANWSLAYTLTGTRQTANAFTTLAKYYEPTVALQVTQPLLRNAWWKYNLSQVELAQVNEAISAESFRQKVEEIVTNVINAYWEVMRTRVNLSILQKLVNETEATLERVKARGELDATAVQIKQAEAAVESRRADVLLAERQVKDAQDVLVRLLADPQINLLSEAEIIPATAPVTEQVQIDLTDRLITALKHNPVLAQARLGLQTADINVYVAENQTLPRLDVTASTTFQGLAGAVHEAHENLGTGNYASYAVGLTAEYPIGNRAAIAELRRQRLSRLRTITDIQNTADLLAQQLRLQVRTANNAYQQMLAYRATVAAAQEQLQALEDTERIRGKLTPEFLQVKLQAQEAVAQAQRAELTSLTVYNSTLADLDRLSGTVLQVQQVRIALPPATDLAGWPEAKAPIPPASAPGAPVTVIDTYRKALTPGGGAEQ